MREILFRLAMLVRRLAARLGRAERAQELSEEMAYHVELLTRDGIARGLEPDVARAAALRSFGNRTTLIEEAHEMWSLGSLDNLLRDARIALRGFRRTPAFTVAAVLILGLGIGMATAMFTTFETILVRRLPVQDQDRIAVLWTYRVPSVELSALATDLPAIRRASHTMREIAGYGHWGTTRYPLLDGDHTIVLNGIGVTGNYFDVLGARPALGRLLRSDDEAPGPSPVMVLSYRGWQSQFGGSPSVIGRQIVDPYTRQTYTVVGVAPPGLDYPIGVEFWVPIARGSSPQIFAVARLAPGATIDVARAEFFAIVNRLHPALKLTGAKAETFTTAALGNVRPILVALTAAVVLLLVIACVNVGNLFLVRAASRARELAVRRALGASYGDIVRELVVESTLLAVAGGALGVACAVGLLHALVRFAPPQLPRLDDVRLHGSVLGAAVGVTALCTLLFGVLPALVAARVNLASPLRRDARSGAETRRRRRMRQWLVASQVALALVMLDGAGLLARSLLRLEQLDLGYQTAHVSMVSVAFDVTTYASLDKEIGWGEQVQQRFRAIPGVTAVTPILVFPFGGPSIWHPPFEAEGHVSSDADDAPDLPIEVAGTQYFQTFGIHLISGRGFHTSDRQGAPLVVVVSESVARRFWPGQNPLGKRIRIPPAPTPPSGVVIPKGLNDWRTVVGVAPDTHFRMLRSASPTVYIPWRQSLGWSGYFAVRSSGEVAGLAAAMRRAVKDVDPTLALFGVRSMDALLGGPLAEPRLSALLLTGFGVVALLLSALGLYGAVASAVREQTRELGIRSALGATPGRLRRRVLGRALAITAAGAVVGLGAALAGSQLLRSLLCQVSPSDPVTLAGVALLLVVVGVAAAYLPARRATQVDPAQVLRAE